MPAAAGDPLWSGWLSCVSIGCDAKWSARSSRADSVPLSREAGPGSGYGWIPALVGDLAMSLSTAGFVPTAVVSVSPNAPVTIRSVGASGGSSFVLTHAASGELCSRLCSTLPLPSALPEHRISARSHLEASSAAEPGSEAVPQATDATSPGALLPGRCPLRSPRPRPSCASRCPVS